MADRLLKRTVMEAMSAPANGEKLTVRNPRSGLSGDGDIHGPVLVSVKEKDRPLIVGEFLVNIQIPHVGTVDAPYAHTSAEQVELRRNRIPGGILCANIIRKVLRLSIKIVFCC